jgi:hypothetical protein
MWISSHEEILWLSMGFNLKFKPNGRQMDLKESRMTITYLCRNNVLSAENIQERCKRNNVQSHVSTSRSVGHSNTSGKRDIVIPSKVTSSPPSQWRWISHIDCVSASPPQPMCECVQFGIWSEWFPLGNLIFSRVEVRYTYASAKEREGTPRNFREYTDSHQRTSRIVRNTRTNQWN